MVFKPHPFPLRRSPIDNSGAYPLGLSLPNMLDLFYDIHSFAVSLSFFLFIDPYMAFLLAGGNTGGIVGALTGLDAATKALEGSTSGSSGKTTRSIIAPHSGATGVCDYAPMHEFSDGDAIFIIDCSNIINVGGLFYPKISIQIGEASSTTGGETVGSIAVGNYGSVPIYASADSIAVGGATISERYSSLCLSNLSPNEGDTINLGISNGLFSNLSSVKSIYVGSTEAKDLRASTSSASFTVPKEPYNKTLVCESLVEGKMNRFFIQQKLGSLLS